MLDTDENPTPNIGLFINISALTVIEASLDTADTLSFVNLSKTSLSAVNKEVRI